MIKYFSALFIILIAVACQDSRKNMIKVDEFQMDKTALKDSEEIEILCGSGNPEYGEEDYYIHLIVRSTETGDTVNLLHSGSVDQSEGRIKNFISNESSTGKVLDNLDRILNSESGSSNVNDMKVKTFDYVFSDPEFIVLDRKRYPAIIGKTAVLVEDGQE